MREMKRRWMKPGRRTREEIIDLLEQEDRGQRRIVWVKQDKKEDIVQGTKLREDRSWKEEEGGGQTTFQDSEVEGDEWEDMIPVEEDSQSRSEGEGVVSTMSEAMGRPRSALSPGRLGGKGKGRKGYWLARREEQIKGRTKSTTNKQKGGSSHRRL